MQLLGCGGGPPPTGDERLVLLLARCSPHHLPSLPRPPASLGEIARRLLLRLAEHAGLFAGDVPPGLRKHFCMDTSHVRTQGGARSMRA